MVSYSPELLWCIMQRLSSVMFKALRWCFTYIEPALWSNPMLITLYTKRRAAPLYPTPHQVLAYPCSLYTSRHKAEPLLSYSSIPPPPVSSYHVLAGTSWLCIVLVTSWVLCPGGWGSHTPAQVHRNYPPLPTGGITQGLLLDYTYNLVNRLAEV